MDRELSVEFPAFRMKSPLSPITDSLPISWCDAYYFRSSLCCGSFQCSRLSNLVRQNHSISNLRIRAIAAELQVKDGVHLRYFKSLARDDYSISEKNSGDPTINKRSEQILPKGLAPDYSGQTITAGFVMKANKDQIFDICIGSRDQSIMLQNFIQVCDQECIKKLTHQVIGSIEQLVFDRYGCYVIKSLLTRSEELPSHLNALCRRQFDSMVDHEFSSRVMQKLIELSPDFRSYAMNKFKKDIGRYTLSVSSRFLVSTGIFFSSSDEERDVVTGFLKSKKANWLHNRLFKKVMVSYLEVCPEDKLHLIYHLLNLNNKLVNFLQEKQSTFILVKFLERGFAQMSEDLLRLVSDKPTSAVKSKFFGFFIGKLLQSPAARSILGKICTLLRSISAVDHTALLGDQRAYQVYCGAVSVIFLSFNSSSLVQTCS